MKLLKKINHYEFVNITLIKEYYFYIIIGKLIQIS